MALLILHQILRVAAQLEISQARFSMHLGLGAKLAVQAPARSIAPPFAASGDDLGVSPLHTGRKC